MDVTRIPTFPTPELTHIAPRQAPVGRGRAMLFQLLFVVMFWSGIYVLHGQATAMVAAERKTREREQVAREKGEAIRRITGQWASAHGDDAKLSFGEDVFVFRRDNAWLPFGFWTDGETYFLRIRDCGEDVRGRIENGELVIEFGEIGERYFEKYGLPWNGVWRFRRQ